MLLPAFIEEMKQKLLSEKQRLEKDLRGLSEHTELGSDLDSQIQEIEGDEVSRDLMAALKSDLAKINKALKKIEEGSYGLDDSGKEISEDRLKVLPWADKAL